MGRTLAPKSRVVVQTLCPALRMKRTPHTAPGQNAHGITGEIDSDRTERARAHLAAIVEFSNDAIVSKTLEGIVASWNVGAERLFGYTAEEMVGESILLLVPADLRDEEDLILKKIKAGERIEHYETERLTKAGHRMQVSLTISPLKDATGKIIGASKIARDITERKRAEEAVRVINAQLSADLSAITRMQQISTRLAQAEDLAQLLDEIVAAGTEITGADMGNIQLFQNGVLQIVSQRGFASPFLDFFNHVTHGTAACGTALERHERIIVEDILKSPIFIGTPALDVMLAADARAVQSTPLISRSGTLLGMFSTHYRTPRRPGDRELRMLDLLARQAADFIESRLSSNALRESEERLRLATEHAEIGFWDVDHVNDVLVWPPRVKAMFGISPDAEVSMRDFYNGLHPEDRAATSEAYAAACDPSRRALYDVEYRTIGKEDGRIRWVGAKGRGVFSVQGRCLRVIGTAIDISKRKETEARLAESEARFRAMAETLPDILYVTDPAGFNEYASPSYTSYTGLSQEQLAGLGWLETIHPEDRARVQEAWNHATASGESYGGEVRLRRHDGAYRWFVSRAKPTRDHSGRILQWFGAATDIEDQKQIERELRTANEDLNQFAFAAAHDLREPLRNVALFTEMLVKSCPDGNLEAIARMKTVITEGVERLENLLNDLLEFSRAALAGEDSAATADVRSAVEKALQNLETTIASSGAKVEYSELPVIRGAETHFLQLFQNLVGNAIQYRGPEPPKITISASMTNEEWLFSVKDNGIGIAPQFHRQIFGLFKRLHGRNIPGTGIGLAICQKIVERYGGQIWVDSTLGQGAEFLFTIPLHPRGR